MTYYEVPLQFFFPLDTTMLYLYVAVFSGRGFVHNIEQLSTTTLTFPPSLAVRFFAAGQNLYLTQRIYGNMTFTLHLFPSIVKMNPSKHIFLYFDSKQLKRKSLLSI